MEEQYNKPSRNWGTGVDTNKWVRGGECRRKQREGQTSPNTHFVHTVEEGGGLSASATHVRKYVR